MRFWGKPDPKEVVRNGIEDLFPRLWRYCLVLTGDRTQADDLAQMTCLRGLEKADKFAKDSHLDRWMFRVAQRLWINEIRKQAVRKGGGLASIDEVDLTDGNPDPEASLLGREVLMGVMRLPEAQRVTVLLVYVEGYSYRDTAQVLDIPVGTVMSRLSVARSKLVKTFGDQKEVG